MREEAQELIDELVATMPADSAILSHCKAGLELVISLTQPTHIFLLGKVGALFDKVPDVRQMLTVETFIEVVAPHYYITDEKAALFMLHNAATQYEGSQFEEDGIAYTGEQFMSAVSPQPPGVFRGEWLQACRERAADEANEDQGEGRGQRNQGRSFAPYARRNGKRNPKNVTDEFQEIEFEVELKPLEARIESLSRIWRELAPDFPIEDEDAVLGNLQFPEGEFLENDTLKSFLFTALDVLSDAAGAELTSEEKFQFVMQASAALYTSESYSENRFSFVAPFIDIANPDKSDLEMCIGENSAEDVAARLATLELENQLLSQCMSYLVGLRTGKEFSDGEFRYVENFLIRAIQTFCGKVRDIALEDGSESDFDSFVFDLCHNLLRDLDQMTTSSPAGRTFRGAAIYKNSFVSTSNVSAVEFEGLRPDATRLYSVLKALKNKRRKKKGQAALECVSQVTTFHAEHKPQSVSLEVAEKANEDKYGPLIGGRFCMASGGAECDDDVTRYGIRFSYIYVTAEGERFVYRMSPIIFPMETPMLVVYYAILAYANGA